MPAGGVDAAVGIMDAAYFTGRRELLDFFNGLFDLNLTKIEQTCSGAVACQLTDYIFPGSIPMQRVNWGAKSDYEYVQNYKLLQVAFTKNRVQRHIDVDKLIRGKYQDNLEFCQWLKAFHDQFGVNRSDYDAVGVRSKGKGTSVWCTGSSRGASRPVQARRPAPTATSRTPAASKAPSATSRPLRERPTAKQTQSNTSPSAKSTESDAALVRKNMDLAAKLEELEQNLVDIEKERDFYFAKLRDIEIMLQVNQEKVSEEREYDALVDKVFKVLYATAEDNLVVTDDGEIVGGADDTLASGAVDGTLGMADELDDEDNLVENTLQSEDYQSY